MSIKRGPVPADNFTIINNNWLRDARLTWKAKGLLAYIASHAPGHVLTTGQIMAQGKESRDAVRTGLLELERAGYLIRRQNRGPDGRVSSTDYELREPGTGEPVPGDDQEKEDVSAGRVQCEESGAGDDDDKKTTPKKTKEDQDPFDADASGPTAQTIIKGFIDWLDARPEPVKLTPSVIARYGKGIKALLQASYDVATIKRALVLQTESGKAGWPSMLDSFCVQVQNRPTSGAPAGAQSFRRQDRQDGQTEATIVRAMEMVMDQDPSVSAKEARKIVNDLIAAGKINLDGLNTSAPTGYSEPVMHVHGSVVEEVTGS